MRCAVRCDRDETLMEFCTVVIGDFFAVLKLRGKRGNNRKRWVGRRASVVDGRVDELVHFHKRLGDMVEPA